MKKLFTLICASVFSTISFSQPIQNSGFESWSLETFFSNPSNFGSSNAQAYYLGGSPNVTKIGNAQQGSFAARLETVLIDGDTIPGTIAIGMPNQGGVAGGIPYTDVPDSVVIYVRYSFMPNDTGFIGVAFKSGGQLVGQSFRNVTGSVGNWTRISTPVQYGSTQIDTIVAFIASANVINDSDGIPGSYLEVDNIQLINASQPFPNGTFEGWSDVNSEEPNNWATFNLISTVTSFPNTVTKTTDAHGGNFAVKITTQNVNGDTLGFLTNGNITENGPLGGMPVNANPKTLSGFYKYTPVGLDTAVCAIISYRYDANAGGTIPIDSSFIFLLPTVGYTSFSATLLYNTFPYADTVAIAFSSSNTRDENSFVGIGSELLIDDLTLEYYPVGIKENSGNINASIYPNPVTDNFYIEYDQLQGDLQFELYNAIGSLVMSQKINAINTGKQIINTNDLQKGIYLYTLVNGEKRRSGMIEIIK